MPERRAEAAGAGDLVRRLSTLVDQLIRENRRLRRELETMQKRRPDMSPAVERALGAIKQKAEAALRGSSTPRRPRRAAPERKT
jgi:hypothetical protein